MVAEPTQNPKLPAIIRPTVGLYLSIGDTYEQGGRSIPKKLDYFRPKPGQVGQFAAAADRFTTAFGAEPRSIPIVFLSDEIGDLLDIRIKWWGLSGLKGMGLTNFATYPAEEIEERIAAWDDEVIVYPNDLSEVPPSMHETWKGEPIHDRLRGPDDPRIAKYTMKVYGVLRAAIPDVTGLATVAEISTTSGRSRRNLHTQLLMAKGLTGGSLVGIPFDLNVRPTRGRYFDQKTKSKKSTDFYELLIESRHTLTELYDMVQQRRVALGAGTAPQYALPPVRHDDVDRDAELIQFGPGGDADARAAAATAGATLPSDEDTVTRNEPNVMDKPDDATLNRIATLEGEYDGDLRALLYGAYAVETAAELTGHQAVMYERSLTRLVDEQAEKVEGEIVDDSSSDFGAPAAAPEQEPEQTSFADLVPEDVKQRGRRKPKDGEQ